MPRKGLPKKYAKHGFAKGWKLYKAEQRKSKRLRGTTSQRKTAPRPASATKLKGATTKMPVKKRTTPARRRPAMGVAKRRTTRRTPKILNNATVKTLLDGLIYGGTAIGSTGAMHFVPWVKDQTSWLKALIQAGTGLILVSAKDKNFKKVGMGFIIGSGISIALPLIPENFKVFGRPFTPAELRALQMGAPFTLNQPRPAMGAPYSLTSTSQNMGTRNSYRDRSR